ncbi:VWA domain-containing protein [Kitasatospora aburaviensis]
MGRALAEFNDRFGRRGMARGAVVVIFSDGWEGEDPSAVGRETARLGRLAHRVVWVNPVRPRPVTPRSPPGSRQRCRTATPS